MSLLPRVLGLALPALFALAACGGEEQGSNTDPDQIDSVATPELGACRKLTPDDVAQRSNATKIVECAEPHTAQTYAVGDLSDDLDDAEYDDEAVGSFAYRTCAEKFEKFLGADESLVLRTIVSWAWFRPSEKAWDEGARWYRCDIVGGSDQSEEFVELPRDRRGAAPGSDRRPLAGVCRRAERGRGHQGAVHRGAPVAGGDHDQAGRAGRRLPG